MLPKKLQHKLHTRQEENSLRQLSHSNTLVDFSSNDYLGLSQSKELFVEASKIHEAQPIIQNGATGSRLLTGNHGLYPMVEAQISAFHNSETALIFNSGYTANLGFFSCVPQRNDIILYDEYCHASIRDGIMMSHAKAYKFKHNDLEDLTNHLNQLQKDSRVESEIYIVTESVFSMDGDTPDLAMMSQISKTHNANLIIDEAHAIGIFGKQGKGIISELLLENTVFARIITFGKALGSHGAAILCSQELKNYLINFSRPLIYTTALPPHAVATIRASYDMLTSQDHDNIVPIKKLHHNISFFKSELERLGLQKFFIESDSAIHCSVHSGNNIVKQISEALKTNGFDVKAILSPTVPKGKERLRFCLHAYNSLEEMTKVLELLATFV